MPKFGFVTALKFAVIASVVISLTGCAESESVDNDKPLVLTTFSVIADMTREVAGDAVDVQSITKIGAEIHGYEPTPSDLKRASQADLILDNGFGLERWFEAFVHRLDVPHVVLTDGIDPIDIRSGEYGGLPNPHAWMSPIAGQKYVANIAHALIELVPERADQIADNAARYTAQLDDLADHLKNAVSALPASQRVLVTCEGAFSYLARDIGLDEGYLWPVNSDTQGAPQQIKSAIQLVRDRNVPVVFCETTVSDGSQQQVARESGARFGGSLYVDSLSDVDGPVPTYLDMLRYDVDLIVKGLSG